MKNIELKKSGSNSIESRHIKKNAFIHTTGNQIKIFPFKTNPSGDTFSFDFKSFQGVIGELFRFTNNKKQLDSTNPDESYKTFLKQEIITNAVGKVETENIEEFTTMISNLFFEEDNSLMKFNTRTISYMNFNNSNNAIKELSKFIYDIFLNDDTKNITFDQEIENDNILHQLIIESLPKLEEIKQKYELNQYSNYFPNIKSQFNKDLLFLSLDKSYLLKHIEDFFKYYFFFYLTQLTFKLNYFGELHEEIEPIYFSLDWETLSESRLNSHKIGWKKLNREIESVFAHANTLELLNYILIDGEKIGSYHNIVEILKTISEDEKDLFFKTLTDLSSFYTGYITNLNAGSSWEDCEIKLNNAIEIKKIEDQSIIKIFSLWYKIKYQFENSARNKPYYDYSKWLSTFCKINYTKNRGRLGATTVLSQELLLFLTKLCIGSENKIRLKSLWERLKDRGIVFDETSKLEITKLFERINLIEKKSDSGDAQYIKSTI